VTEQGRRRTPETLALVGMSFDQAGLYQGIEYAAGRRCIRRPRPVADIALQPLCQRAQARKTEARVIFVAFNDAICRISP